MSPVVAKGLGTVWEQAGSQLARKRPNGIPDTGAADKEHTYESATRQLGFVNAAPSRIYPTRSAAVRDQRDHAITLREHLLDLNLKRALGELHEMLEEAEHP